MRRFLMVVLLASLVLWMPQSTVLGSNHIPSVPRADVEATALRIVGPDPMWVDDEPTDTTIEVDFTNRGTMDSSAYAVQYSWVDDVGTVTPLNGGATYADSTKDGPPVDQGQTVSDQTIWNLQPEQTGQGAIRVTIDQDGRTTDMDFSQFVPNHRVTYTIQGEAQEIRPDETRFFRVVATNEGNVEKTVSLDITDADVGDNARLEPGWDQDVFTVPPGSSRDATLFLSYPSRGDTEPLTASFTINASAPLLAPVSLQTPSVTLGTIGPGGYSGYSFTLDAPAQETVFAQPGTTEEVRLRLANTASNDGNLSDTYQVTAQATGGWSATVQTPRMALEEQASDWVVIHLQPPSGAAPGTPAILDVEVVSDHDDPSQPRFPAHRSVPLRVSGPAMTITDIHVGSTLYRGDAPEVVVTLTNQGDAETPEGTLHVRVDAGTHDQDAETAVDPVPVGRSSIRRIHLQPIGTGGEVVVEAEWIPDPGASGVLGAQGQVTRFLHDPDLVLTPAQALGGVPGADVRYAAPPHAFTLRNAGNAAETVVLAVSSQGGTARLLGDETMRLEPGDVRTIPLVQGLPRPATNLDPRTVSVHVSVQGRPDLSWNASTDTHVVDPQGPVFVNVTMPAEWSFTSHRPMPLQAIVTDESAVGSVVATITRPSGTDSTVDLHEVQTSPGTWEADHLFLSQGNHTLVLHATDLAGNQATSSTYRIRLGVVPPPDLRSSVQSGDAVPWNGSIQLTVQDVHEVTEVHVSVLDDDNTLTFHPFPVEDGRANITLQDLQGLEPGNVTLFVQAANAAGAIASLDLELVLLEPEETQALPTPGDKDKDRGLPAPSWLLVALASLAAASLHRARRGPGQGPDGVARPPPDP